MKSSQGVPRMKTGKVGERVALSAEGSTDPDGDNLSYKWIYYGEVGPFTMPAGKSIFASTASRRMDGFPANYNTPRTTSHSINRFDQSRTVLVTAGPLSSSSAKPCSFNHRATL